MQTSVLQCRIEAFPELPEQKGKGSKPGPDRAMGLTPSGSRSATPLILTHPLQNNLKKEFILISVNLKIILQK